MIEYNNEKLIIKRYIDRIYEITNSTISYELKGYNIVGDDLKLLESVSFDNEIIKINGVGGYIRVLDRTDKEYIKIIFDCKFVYKKEYVYAPYTPVYLKKGNNK